MNKEEVRKEAEAEFRDGTETGDRVEDTEPEKPLSDQLAETLEEIEGNRGSHVVTANSPDLWALLTVLDENPERRAEFFERFNLSDADGKMNRSAVLKRLVEHGLRSTDPELLDVLQEAKQKQEQSDGVL